MESLYKVPDWAGKPSNSDNDPDDPFYLEVLKDGVVIENIPLSTHSKVNKSYLLLGRQADMVDITLDNPSISRQHAVIQFSKLDASIFLVDLGSAQGTFVNKMKIKSHIHHKIYVGDIIKFASSTRMFVLMGSDKYRPPEYDSANLQQLREKSQSRSADAALRKEKESAISWGIDDNPDDSMLLKGKGEGDDEVPQDESEEGSLMKLKRFVERSREVGRNKCSVEKLLEHEAKIRRLEEDNRRISAKELSQESGLTPGQIQALERNSAIIEKVYSEIHAILAEQSIGTSSASEVKKFEKGKSRDEDFMFDTTQDTADTTSNWRMRRKNKGAALTIGQGTNGILSYEGLLLEKAACELTLAKIKSRKEKLAVIIESSSESGDVDQVISQLKRQEAISALRTLAQEEAEQIEKLRLTEKYARLAAPALSSLVKQPNQQSTSNSSLPIDAAIPIAVLERTFVPEVVGPEVSDVLKDEGKVLGPSAEYYEPELKEEAEEEAEAEVEEKLEYVTEKRLVAQEVGLKNDSSSSIQLSQPPQEHCDTIVVTPIEPRQHQPLKKPKLDAEARGKRTTTEPESLGPSSTLQGGETVWRPPVGQTGTGRTALNDKYGY